MIRIARTVAVLSTAALLGIGGASFAGVVLDPEQAPHWEVSEWINGDAGRITDHRGKIILINFFQLWCPGSNSFSIPLFKRWEELYGDRDDVLIVSLHTVFEGHDVQTPERLREFVAEKGIHHPVGIDAYASPGDEVPITMDRYETGGTPHVAIVDGKGKLRFSHFGRFDVVPVEAFIDRLLKENSPEEQSIRDRFRKRR